MEDTLKKILAELQRVNDRLEGLENGQQELQRDVSSIKDNLINGLGPYFERIEKHIDEKTGELKDSFN